MPVGSLTVVDADAPRVRRTKSVKIASKTTPKRAVAKKRAPKVTKKKATKSKPKTKAKKTTQKTKKPSAPKKLNIIESEAPRTRCQPLGHLLIEKMLREEGFRGGVSSDKSILEAYSTDESIFSITPQIVIQPKDQRDIEITVTVLGRETCRFPFLSLTPRAAGTGLSGGSLTDSIIIDVSTFMNHIGEIQSTKTKSTITVEPGAMWLEVEKKLKEKELYLPPAPASKDICSIGGSIANNAAGPDSLRFGHCADWVESLDVTLYDGQTYTLKPINYKEYKALIKKENALSTILEKVLGLIEKHEKAITNARPKTKKNTAGYALWDVLDGSVASFKRGSSKLDLTRLISGSQGTIGIITSITLRAEPINTQTELVVVPIFDIQDATKVITKALDYSPLNLELFDGLTYELAMSNPEFFRERVSAYDYCQILLSMYTTYHVRYRRKTPELTLLITIDTTKLKKATMEAVVLALKKVSHKRARHITNRAEKKMFWLIRRASYSLSKYLNKDKRPAAFLEDMTVPPQNLPRFFLEVKKLLKKYNVTATVHGHGGNGHLHFYPLLDFTNKTTPALVEKMAEEFFAAATKFDGSICGEHNDGIIRTPHLNKMFTKEILNLFAEVEKIFDPDDIFNPGKKVNPRFDVKAFMRKTN